MSALAADKLEMLDRVALFRGLAPAELSLLKGLLRRKKFPAGSTVMTVGQMGEVVYIILDGTLKVHLDQADGSDVIISILGAGEVVGEMSVLDDCCRSANALTLEESTLLWMDRATFHDCLRRIPLLSYNLLCILSGRLRLANEQIQALASLEVESRVARQILAFAERYGEAAPGGEVLIPIRLTQSDIASLIGASRKSTNEVVASYKKRGYISVDHGHRITIHNRSALANRCR